MTRGKKPVWLHLSCWRRWLNYVQTKELQASRLSQDLLASTRVQIKHSNFFKKGEKYKKKKSRDLPRLGVPCQNQLAQMLSWPKLDQNEKGGLSSDSRHVELVTLCDVAQRVGAFTPLPAMGWARCHSSSQIIHSPFMPFVAIQFSFIPSIVNHFTLLLLY